MTQHITRVIAICTIIIISSFSSTPAAAQTGLEILEHYWKGVSVVPVNFTKSGKAILTHEMKIKHTGQNKFAGKVTTTFDFDGALYKCTLDIMATYYDIDHTFVFKTGDMTYADKLPYDLEWCGSYGTLTLYSDAERDGYYLLSGNTKDTCGGTSEMEFSDYQGR